MSRRVSDDVHVQNFVSPNAPVQDVVSSSMPVTSSTPLVTSPSRHTTVEPTSLTTDIQDAPVQKVAHFIPKFKGAAEMEKRRRARMAARRRPGPAAMPLPPQSDSSDDVSSSDGDFDDDVPGDVDSMDEGDDFDLQVHQPSPGPLLISL